MSWRYSKYYGYHRSSYKPNFYYSEKELDFTNENLDYKQFLLQEFFNADAETKRKISNYYIDKFGDRSFAYLKSKYSEWANGNYHLTDLMSGRIISIMPRFLNSEAKHKLGIHQFMSTIKESIKAFERQQNYRYNRTKYISRTSELLEIFEKEYSDIQSYSYDSLNIYGHRSDMLKDDELIEAIEISKYILEVKLQNLYDQIDRDFQIFLPFIKKLKIGTFESSFRIKEFDIVINLAKLDSNEIKVPNLKITEIESNTVFKKYSDKYLTYELSEVQKIANSKSAISFLNNNDLKVFINQFTELCKGENKVELNSSFKGQSGILSLSTKYIPSNTIHISILVSLFKILIYLVVSIGLGAFALINKAFILLIIGGFFIGIYAFAMISIELKELQTLKQQYKDYVRQ